MRGGWREPVLDSPDHGHRASSALQEVSEHFGRGFGRPDRVAENDGGPPGQAVDDEPLAIGRGEDERVVTELER